MAHAERQYSQGYHWSQSLLIALSIRSLAQAYIMTAEHLPLGILGGPPAEEAVD